MNRINKKRLDRPLIKEAKRLIPNHTGNDLVAKIAKAIKVYANYATISRAIEIARQEIKTGRKNIGNVRVATQQTKKRKEMKKTAPCAYFVARATQAA